MHCKTTNIRIGFSRQGTAHTIVAALLLLLPACGDDAHSPYDGGQQLDAGVDAESDGGTPDLPPDPSTVAPPVDPTVASSIAENTAFLYSGPTPIQTGVAPGTIQATRVAVLRGKVENRDGTALPAVKVSVLSHSELGQTLTRADGAFDLAVNGGGQLTLRYEKAGFLAAQRAVVAPWRDYAWLPDVVLVPIDTTVTEVNLSVAAMQVVRGSPVSDADGARRATVLFPQGTTATMALPDGTTQPLTTLNVRVTEYTIGASGPKAMPASLPPSSGYTYAAELSVDEAVAAGATDVRFNQAVPMYVENFLGFPVGTAVPAGYYDRQKGQWVASVNGQVIKVVGLTGGLADVDLDGNDVADDAAALAALGVTADERARLASLYTPGQTLWRTPIMHFTPWDCNWPYGPPPDATPPPGPNLNNPPVDHPEEECGSVIGCETQTLGESVPLSGTPWRLHYRSNRTPGSKDAYTLKIPVSGAAIPASLRGIRVEVRIAGRLYKASFAPMPNLSHTMTWDGKDGYGRRLLAPQIAEIQVHYDYAPQYYAVLRSFQSSFARAEAAGAVVSVARGDSIALSKAWHESVGIWDARAFGLGGLSLSIQHSYETDAHTLRLGNGQQRRGVGTSSNIITTVAGIGVEGFGGDGGPAVAAMLSTPSSVAVAPDGSFYIAVDFRVRRVGSDGIITTFAGSGSGGFDGDGGPAVEAKFSSPLAVTVGPDGSLYIADKGNHRIRRVGPDGIIATIAGSGVAGLDGDGGPAVAAKLRAPSGVAVGPDGSLYIADTLNDRIRRVGTDGIITTFAGSVLDHGGDYNGDGGPAARATLDDPIGIAVGLDNSLYIADSGKHRIRRVGPDGIITTIAGTGVPGYNGDGGPAGAAKLLSPISVAVGPDGCLYIADWGNQYIRRVGPDGIMTTVAGGVWGFDGDGGPAAAAALRTTVDVVVGPDGNLYIVDAGNNRIRRVSSRLPDISISDLLLPSEDGHELYVFTSSGRHLKTLDALTGALRYQFGYSSDGYLTSVTDAFGNVTTIERTGATAKAFVAPDGQRTVLNVADGWLVGVTNPAGETHTMSYSADGLLQHFTDQLGKIHSFTYDALGRLIKDEDPVGGSTTLARTEQSNGYTVTTTSALGRSHVYQVEQLPTGTVRRSVTGRDGTTTVMLIKPDGSEQTTDPDGTLTTVQHGPDPRWGMLAPIATRVTVTTPGGHAPTVTSARTAVLADPNNLLSLTKLTDTVTEGGLTSTVVYDAATRTSTMTTPMGRVASARIDASSLPVEATAPGVLPVSVSYDTRGRPVQVAQGPRATTTTWGADGFVASLADPLTRTTQFQYDAIGRPTKVTRPDSKFVQLGYDAVGNVTQLTPPDKPTHGFGYTAISLLESYQPPSLPGVGNDGYTYDFDRALTVVTHPDGTSSQYTRDAAGRLTLLRAPWGDYDFTYDSAGRAESAAHQGQSLQWSYDGFLPTGETSTGPVAGTVIYTYDNKLRVDSIAVNSAPVAYVFDDDGLVTQAGALALTRSTTTGQLTGAIVDTVASTWSYDAFGALETTSASVSGSTVFQETLTRDALARVTAKIENVQGVTTTWTYGYDLAGRLQQVTKDGATTGTYVFDANGNRTSANGIAATFDAQDRLLTAGTLQFTYDAFGSVIEKRDTATTPNQVTRYQYDGNGGLRKATLPDGTVLDYLVDSRGRRVGKKRNGVLERGWLYDGQLRIVAELDGSGAVTSRFVYGTLGHSPDYLERGGTTYRFIHDSLGSVRFVINSANGAVAQHMDYDEWGNILANSAPDFQPFGFAGGLNEVDLKWVKFGARDHDPAIGRWTAKDPIRFNGGDANLYAYALNDPIAYVDSSGRARWRVAILVGKSGLRAGKRITEKVARSVMRQGGHVVTETEKDAARLAKELSHQGGGGGHCTAAEAHEGGTKHVHALGEGGERISRHIFFDEDLLMFPGLIFDSLFDSNGNGTYLDMEDIFNLVNPIGDYEDFYGPQPRDGGFVYGVDYI